MESQSSGARGGRGDTHGDKRASIRYPPTISRSGALPRQVAAPSGGLEKKTLAMGDEIRSHDQQGGITAGQVNIGSDGSGVPESQKRSPWKIIGVVAAVISAIVAVLSWLGVMPWWGQP